MALWPCGQAQFAAHILARLLDGPGHAATVGVAQHQPVGALAGSSAQAVESIELVGGIAIQEMLRIDDHLPAGALEQPDAVCNHGQVLKQAAPENLVHLCIPGLGDQRHRRRPAFQERLQLRVAGSVDMSPPSAAERSQAGARRRRRGRQLVVPTPEKHGVLGVAARPAAFHVGHAEVYKVLRDLKFIVR